jgi:hypothetical protein
MSNPIPTYQDGIAEGLRMAAELCDNYERNGQTYKEYSCETADEIASRIRTLIEQAPASPISKVELDDMRLRSYQTGWDDGYAEGFGKMLVDVTEPFNPTPDPRVARITELEAALKPFANIARFYDTRGDLDFVSSQEIRVGFVRRARAALAGEKG